MNNQILIKLRKKLDDVSVSGTLDAEMQRNVLKEDLQYYILNFIYHHPNYSNWTMYGGSALRICHKLDRMSVDLDFEIDDECTDIFLTTLKTDVENHFKVTYATDSSFLTIKVIGNRGLRLNFFVGEDLGINHPSKQVHVKVDLNCFTAPKMSTERIPISYDQFSFVIKTYNIATLMASKIAAIFLRGQRGIGKEFYEEKGRDIYDLLWYMQKKIIPDLDYLVAKGIDVKDLRGMFTKLTIKMNSVDIINLEQDLKPLFLDQSFITNWLKTWRENYLHLQKDYSIYKVKELKEVLIYQDFMTDVFSFIYYYETEESKLVRIIYKLSGYWIDFRDGDLSVKLDDEFIKIIKFDANGISSRPASQDKLKQYATLFYAKTEAYFKKTNKEMVRHAIITKTIRMTADNLNHKEQIVLDKSALIGCDLDDLLP